MAESHNRMKRLELWLHDMDEGEEEILKEILHKVAIAICNGVDVSDVSFMDGENVVAYTCLELVGHEHAVYELVKTQDADPL